jgi:hypothetical protein
MIVVYLSVIVKTRPWGDPGPLGTVTSWKELQNSSIYLLLCTWNISGSGNYSISQYPRRNTTPFQPAWFHHYFAFEMYVSSICWQCRSPVIWHCVNWYTESSVSDKLAASCFRVMHLSGDCSGCGVSKLRWKFVFIVLSWGIPVVCIAIR